MQEQVRSAVTGYTKENSTDRISFDEWNGDKLAGLLLQGILREEIMPKNLRSHFQKAVALLDEPDIACQHFGRLVYELSEAAKDGKTRIRTARQLYIALWVLFVWARDIDNVEAPYRASELVLLSIWNLLRPYIGKERSTISKAIIPVLHHALALHVGIASELLEKKILSHVDSRDGISMAVRTRSSVDVNLRLFDILGRIGLTAIWKHWLNQLNPDTAQRALAEQQIARWTTLGYLLIENNRALFLPLRDEHAIEISLFLISVSILKGNGNDARSWLDEMARRLAFTIQTHGRYPCVFSEYRDLDAHPREKTDEYRNEATAGSILIPLIAAFLSALDCPEALRRLVALKENELQHCTLQLWMPDESSEDGIYLGTRDHGVTLCDLPLSVTCRELISTVRDAGNQSRNFEELSAIATNCWPIILTACRHHRLPVPPQFWIKMVGPAA
jgi:hypothetical protein